MVLSEALVVGLGWVGFGFVVRFCGRGAEVMYVCMYNVCVRACMCVWVFDK